MCFEYIINSSPNDVFYLFRPIQAFHDWSVGSIATERDTYLHYYIVYNT